MPGNVGRPTKLDQVLRTEDTDRGPVEVTVAEHVVRALGAGSYVEEAAASAGVAKSTVYKWMTDGARIGTDVEQGRRKLPRAGSRDRQLLDFSYAVAQAQAEWEVRANATLEHLSRARTVETVTTVTEATEDGPVVKVTKRTQTVDADSATIRWRLERKNPARYGKSIEVSGPGGGAIPVDIRTAALEALGKAADQLAANADATQAQLDAEVAAAAVASDRPAGEPPA